MLKRLLDKGLYLNLTRKFSHKVVLFFVFKLVFKYAGCVVKVKIRNANFLTYFIKVHTLEHVLFEYTCYFYFFL